MEETTKEAKFFNVQDLKSITNKSNDLELKFSKATQEFIAGDKSTYKAVYSAIEAYAETLKDLDQRSHNV